MEAALRTAVEKLSGEELKSLDFTEVRGTDGIKEASYTVNGMEVKVCVVSGLANANTIMEKVKNGTADYHFIEIMGCPGGCVNGGGQRSSTLSCATSSTSERAEPPLSTRRTRICPCASRMRARLSSVSMPSSSVSPAATRRTKCSTPRMLRDRNINNFRKRFRLLKRDLFFVSQQLKTPGSTGGKRKLK